MISSNGAAEFWTVFAGIATYIAIFAIITGTALFILGSIVEVGYMKFNLNLVDRQKEDEISTMFGFFQFWKSAACARLLKGVYVLLWSLLFIIPGIIAGYSYAMTSYILAENPELTSNEARGSDAAVVLYVADCLYCVEIVLQETRQGEHSNKCVRSCKHCCGTSFCRRTFAGYN